LAQSKDEFGHDIIIAFVVDRIALAKIENGLGGSSCRDPRLMAKAFGVEAPGIGPASSCRRPGRAR